MSQTLAARKQHALIEPASYSMRCYWPTIASNQAKDKKMDHSKMAGDNVKAHDKMAMQSKNQKDDKMSHNNKMAH